MSSTVGEETVQAVSAGRETLGAIFSSAQAHLQKIFIVFVIGFIGSFYALRIWIWDFLEATAKAEMAPEVAEATDLITRTPFEVILLQAKIGLIVGIILAIPAVLYFSREALRRRGIQSVVPISRAYMAGFAATAFLLFWGGVIYAYAVFFPYAFGFLGDVTYETGVKPSFGITEFTEFIALLTLSFGLAAQLPLFMSVLSYTEIVRYETFRDKWRYAIIGIFVFGAFFSPPDPFTQIMWAAPLIVLYVFSLGLAKLVTNIRRKGAAQTGSGTALVKRRTLQFGVVLGLTFVAVTAAINQGAFALLEDEVYPLLGRFEPAGPTSLEVLAADHGLLGEAASGLLIALSLGVFFLLLYTLKVLQSPVYPREEALIHATDPDDVDFELLDADSIDDLSADVFLAMEEDQALELAREAMYDDDREKAEAIITRFDRLQEQAAASAAEDGAEGDGVASSESAAASADTADESEGGLFSSTAAGMIDPFTEDETTEEDIGGYAYDLMFILRSLTSKMFRIVAVFMIVLGGSFFWMYQGGLRQILLAFLDRVPEHVLHEVAVRNEVDPEGMTLGTLIDEMGVVIALHPVEVLIFIVKVSTLAAIISILPMVCYYGWPAAKERGLVRGDRRLFIVWGGSLLAGFAFGTYLGFFWIAPAVISYLIADAINAGMVVSYRMKSFFWLVIFTTVGIGFLFNMIVTMALFHVGGIVSYRRMLWAWRPMVVAIFTVAAFVSPRGILTMLVLAIPVALTYMLGLAVLYVLTAGGRLFGGGGGRETEPEPEGGLTTD
ncbi:twin-arginine translocase subunit TatC [Natronobeatus ordinarius]|uniref:twin-arginine translocase subunit TatC n=1 Tax=Natronobeatus ordinarius TaxID=2963433 RepID=UPI0020CE4BE3|nr:twin-arginine translocase subunit TatC [Natronobeatus ordinarius]